MNGSRTIFSLMLVCVLAMGCDPEHKKKCEWYLMPNDAPDAKVEKGFVPVCARNLVVNKQDCRLQTYLSFVKKHYGRKFRYSDLKVVDYGLPRTIESIKFCK